MLEIVGTAVLNEPNSFLATEKDFSDLAEIMQHQPLDKLLSTFKIRYPYYTVSAVFAILLKPEVFERDESIRYAPGKSYSEYCTSLKEAITSYENQLLISKEQTMMQREKKIQSLIEQKRKGK